jgi:PhnB protein
MSYESFVGDGRVAQRRRAKYHGRRRFCLPEEAREKYASGVVDRPERYRNAIVPHIYVDGAADAIAFYTRAFGAVELFRIAHPNGKILHAEVSIAGSVVMIGDPDEKLYGDPRALGWCTTSLHIFVDEHERFLRRAVQAGAQIVQPPTDMFYGATSASVRDPFGHVWVLLSWREDLEPAEMERRGHAALKGHDGE